MYLSIFILQSCKSLIRAFCSSSGLNLKSFSRNSKRISVLYNILGFFSVVIKVFKKSVKRTLNKFLSLIAVVSAYLFILLSQKIITEKLSTVHSLPGLLSHLNTSILASLGGLYNECIFL